MESQDSPATRIQALLDKGLVKRVRAGLGGSHTVVTYPPLDALQPLDRVHIPIGSTADGVNLYFHIAFCEYICPFCHYAKTYTGIGNDSEQVLAYMKALTMEMALRKREIGATQIRSIYVGGGTPTSLSIKLLDEFVAALQDLVGSLPQEFCVETSPLTISTPEGRQKINHLRSVGVNRFSVGIQTFDDATLHRLRGHGRRTAEEAIEYLLASGADVNIDLMQDLPYQTAHTIEDDLTFVQRFRPAQVTWYMLRFHDEASWYKTFNRGDLYGIPNDLDSAVRRVEITRAMTALGYTARPGGRFILSPRGHDHYKEVRGGTDQALLGFGVSAYSHGWGWFFRNVTARSGKSGIAEYVRRLRAGENPVTHGFEMTPEERIAGRFVTGVRESIDPAWLEQDDAVSKAAFRIAHQLVRDGALEVGLDGQWVLTEAGSAFEEEIASLFYSPAVRQRLSEQNAYWASDRYSAETVAGSTHPTTNVGA